MTTRSMLQRLPEDAGVPGGTIGGARGRGERSMLVGGVRTSHCTRAELAELMVADCRRNQAGELDAPRLVFSSNGSVIARYHQDPGFREVLDQADVLDADGMPLVLATRLLCRNPLPERVATTDFVHDACDAAASNGLRFYFLGGKAGVARRAADALVREHPGLAIAGARDGFFAPGELDAVLAEIVAAGTDVLWVGFGSPHQETFAVQVRDRLCGVAWIRTCGGLFDFKAGDALRAPMWMQSASLEWLFRMVREPRRLGLRYLTTNPVAAFYLATRTRG